MCTPASTASCRAARMIESRAAIGPEQPVPTAASAQRERERHARFESGRRTKPTGVEDEHAAARRVKGELHGRKPARRKVGIRAARADGVQVQGQLDARAGDGDGLGELRAARTRVSTRSQRVRVRVSSPSQH